MILVCPDWQRDLWWKGLQDIVVDKILFPKGQKIFKAPGQKEVQNELEEEDEEGDVFELDVFAPCGLEVHKVRAFQARMASETEEERVEELRRRIFEDFEGKVLDVQVPRDPPSRGPFGTAHIYLKPGAQPTRQKVYTMFGEKQEAHKKVT
ncbi:hypothetical protein M569_10576 [Genlisea aurea]|uniref:Uncharacterized protein n=1 Tax=Genlisea aurea TaxID=192259 RepID=S8CBG4_9LAMI|nr:hypothetical protein M569_10576 [Genlisea aurea]